MGCASRRPHPLDFDRKCIAQGCQYHLVRQSQHVTFRTYGQQSFSSRKTLPAQGNCFDESIFYGISRRHLTFVHPPAYPFKVNGFFHSQDANKVKTRSKSIPEEAPVENQAVQSSVEGAKNFASEEDVQAAAFMNLSKLTAKERENYLEIAEVLSTKSATEVDGFWEAVRNHTQHARPWCLQSPSHFHRA